MTQPYTLYGVEPSFFTQKGLAILRAKHVPHLFHYKSFAVKAEVEAAVHGYSKIPVIQTPQGDWLTDTTSIALELDRRHTDTQLIPTDPVWAIVVRILDDWVDEWLIRPAFHWRALTTGAESRAWRTIARNSMGLHRDQPLIDEQETKMMAIADQLVDFATHVARANRTGPGHEAEIETLLDDTLSHISAGLAQQPFLLGDAPSLADCALAGALHGHLLWEEEPRVWIRTHHPAVLDYGARLERPQAPATWQHPARLTPASLALLAMIARTYHRFLSANRDALTKGQPQAQWDKMDMPVRKYTEKQRLIIADLLNGLSMSDSIRLGKLTAGTGVLDVFAPVD